MRVTYCDDADNFDEVERELPGVKELGILSELMSRDVDFEIELKILGYISEANSVSVLAYETPVEKEIPL